VGIDPQGSNAVRGNWPLALFSSQVVQPGSYGWYAYSNMVLGGEFNGFSSYSFSSYTGSFTFYGTSGNFIGNTDRYVGLRIELSGNEHYGWARIDVLSPTSFTLKDYAINLTPNQSIITGDTGLAANASPAQNVVLQDVADAGNSSDLHVQFDQAANEASVLLYRAIVVKESSAASFTLQDAQAQSSLSALSIVPNGTATYSESLLGGMADSDGDLITVGIPYQVFIHTISDQNVALNDVLSNPSDTVVLESIPDFGPVQAVNIVDVNNNVNGTDMEVNFNKLANETGLNEYRIFVVKAANANSFNLLDAQGNNNFFAVTPNGQNISTELLATSADVDGDAITEGVPYRAFVMSKANGVLQTQDFLSPASNELTLDGSVGIDPIDANDRIKVAYTNEGVRLSAIGGNRFQHHEVFTAQGRSVQRAETDHLEIELNRSELAAGVYMIRLSDSDGDHYTRIVLH